MTRTSLMDTMLSSVLLIGFVLVTVSQVDAFHVSKCPTNALKNESIQIPHDNDCTKYYTCLGGENKVLRECPLMDSEGNRLHFNAKLKVCDWPWAAECDLPLTIKAIRKISFQPKPIPIKCPKVDSKYETVHLASEHDCTKFYKCLQGRKLLMSCPSDQDGNKLYFNPRLQVCDWPYNVDCQQPELTLRKRPVAAVPTECPKYDSVNKTVLLAHESDCTKFYICSNGKKILRQCPEMDDEGNRLYFNPEEQVCDWPANVDCKLPKPIIMRMAPKKKILPVPTECPEKDPVEYEINIAHESDCTKYYKCFRGIKYLLQCPKIEGSENRYFFNKFEQQCEWPWKADCNYNDLPSTNDTPTTNEDDFSD